MAGELGEASQAISVGINGATVAMKGSKQLIEQMIKFIWFILKNTTFKDKENLKKLLSDPGKKTLCEFNDKDMKEVKSELNKLGVPYVIFLGEDEIAEGVLSVKDMRSGEQKKLSPDEAAALLLSDAQRRGNVKLICE